MMSNTNTLSSEFKKDVQRNRDGRLSSRQWIALITEPLISLLLLAVPLILLVGRGGIAGRYIVLIVMGAVAVTMVFRAFRFARVTLHYRVLHVETARKRWMFWRKLKLTTKMGDTITFDQQITTKLNLPLNQAVHAYYIVIADRKILVSLLPEKHPQANLATPTNQFSRRNGVIHTD